MSPDTSNATQRSRRPQPHERAERTRSEIAPADGFPPAAAHALEAALRRHVEGEVRFDDASRALYATDSSNYRQVPIGVVVPRSIDDVVETMRLCRAHGAPFLSRGGGTSLAGQCCNVAVVVDYSKHLNRLLELDPTARRARVQPGIILDELRDAAERHHLTFGPDPSTHDHNSLGGMIGNNSCGVHSVMAGRTADNVEALEVLTYDGLRLKVGPTSEAELAAIVAAGGRRGEIYRRLDALRRTYGELIRARYPKIPRRVSGYNLDNLLPENRFNVARALVGSEGTCVAVLEATLRLVPSPPCRALTVIGFADIFTAGDAVPAVLEHHPIGLEAIDQELIDFMKVKHLRAEDLKLMPQGCGWLIAEFGGESADEAAAKADRLKRAIEGRPTVRSARIYRDPGEQKRIWRVRQAGLGGTAFVPHHPETWEGWEDSAVAPEQVGSYLRDLKALFERYQYDSALYGHFGDGCIHCRINFGLRTREGVRKWRRFLDEAADLVVRHGGSLSGEHGDGQSKAELLGKMYGPELLRAFEEFKSIWDPEWKMNPGKVTDPYPITSNLRLGPDYHAPQVETHFAFPDDHGNFAHAAMRCVGVGECRRIHSDEGVMCPSYMATREEMHSTRGRGHLLFEMMHGGAIERSWRNPAVEEALSLCLACKGCKSDCPVNVDMATYKAEFRSHFYAGRLRPRAAYSMGLIHWWARLADAFPMLARLVTQSPGPTALAKLAGGIAQQRRMPAFAPESFRDWFARREPPRMDGDRRVMLFPDTFSNFFRPATAIAATRVIEAAGWKVEIPARPLCCGRPLYDWGMLDTAKAQLRTLLDGLRPAVEAGMPVVGLEPACVSAFRDELPNLFPNDKLAWDLAGRTLLFSEFLDRHCGDLPLPRLERKALVQIHCHHHAVIKDDAERRVMARLGLDAEILPSGCCGMAGSFGFEADKVDVSMAAAERVVLPRLRRAPADTLILADGFSCREQIEQGTGRRTLHLAEAIAEAMDLGDAPALRRRRTTPAEATLLLGGALALGLLIGGRALSRTRG
jgi:FAD/FMN-containing dehydrogenase/Fe-S oxidoreductase